MELLVVRHAEAEEPAGFSAREDRLRRLTPRGRRRMQSAVRGLQALSLGCELCLHSPWTRAEQTAALLAPLVPGGARACAALARAPDDRLLALLRRLQAPRGGGRRAAPTLPPLRDDGAPGALRSGPQAEPQRIALVGHQPWLGELIMWLAAGEREAGVALRLGKGSVAWLSGSLEPGGMELVALLPARMLRRLGRSSRRQR